MSARELTQAALERIEGLDGQLNAFVAVDGERAMAEAAEIDDRVAGEGSVGMLAGIPLAVKDLEDAAGYPTRYGSKLSPDGPAAGDSVLVARLRAAGCIVVGKTATPEYGHKGVTESPVSGVTRNPWNPDRTPGGSSGGSAAALASGMVPLATGSDGGGSIRIPSALCGLSGIKTTQGRVPNGGPNPPGSGLLSVKGPMTRVISDTAFVLDACIGPHPTDPFSLPMASASWYEAMESARLPATVAWSPTLGFAEVDEEIAAICQGAVEQLEQAGTEVRQIDEVWPSDPVAPWLAMWTTSRARTQGDLLGSADYELIDESLRAQIEWGMGVPGVDVMRAIDAIHEYGLLLNDVFEHAPVLVTPVCAGRTPYVGHDGVINGEEVLTWVGFTYGFNMTRNPAGTVNVGFTSDGMPVGLQVVGRQRDDVVVLQTLAALEELYGTDHRAPIGS